MVGWGYIGLVYKKSSLSTDTQAVAADKFFSRGPTADPRTSVLVERIIGFDDCGAIGVVEASSSESVKDPITTELIDAVGVM